MLLRRLSQSCKSWQFLGQSFIRKALPASLESHRTKKRIIPFRVMLATCKILLFGFIIIWANLSLAQTNMSPPQYNGQLSLTYDFKTKERPSFLDPNGQTEIPFFGERIDFLYGVKRDKGDERKPGALIIKVIYLYDSGLEDIADQIKNTELYRNEFPYRKGELDYAIRREYYQEFHKDGIFNYYLHYKFHAIFSGEERTDGTYQKKRKFLYTADDKWKPAKSRQRTFLIYYWGVDDPGTWIKFYVGVNNHMSNILISIIDLGEPCMGDLVERTYQISNKR